MKKYLGFAFSLGIFFCTSGLEAKVIYVDQNATGNNNGNSWTDAYTDLQSGINASSSSDSIWVAQGEYIPAKNVAGNSTPTDPRTKLFIVHTKDVKLFGGFSGSETNFEDRDWRNNPTILSGDLGVKNDNTDNCYSILHLFNSSMVLDGFTIQDGNADGESTASQDKKTGAGIYYINKQGTRNSTITNCVFKNNNARSEAGLFVTAEEGTINIDVTNSRFTFNVGRWAPPFSFLARGGNINPNLINCLIDNNLVDQINGEPGNNFPAGRFIAFENNSSIEGKIINCTFSKNKFQSSTVNDADKVLFGIQEKNTTNAVNNTEIYNTIFFDNEVSSAGVTLGSHHDHFIPDSMYVSHTITEDSVGVGANDFITSVENLQVDPLFKDVANNNFDLETTSPAINAGEVTNISSYLLSTDFLGRNRIADNKIDLGCFEHPSTVSLLESDYRNSLTIFPNPVTTHLYVDLDDQIESLEIRNFVGKVFIQSLKSESIIPVNELPDGVYLIIVRTKKGVFSSKFVKN
jgi:hypothetical protein